MVKTATKERLTGLQQLFVNYYCTNGFNGLQAAKSAGYGQKGIKEPTPTYLSMVAARNVAKDNIRAEIEAFRAAKQENISYSREKALVEYDRVLETAFTPQGKKLALDAANTAIKGKARLFGLDLDHTEVDIFPGRRPDNTAEAVQASKDKLLAFKQLQAGKEDNV